MSSNLLELYKLLLNFASNPDDMGIDEKLSKYDIKSSYAEDILEFEGQLNNRVTLKNLIEKNINVQDLRWFVQKVKEDHHPIQIFLNKLVSNTLSTSDHVKVYEKLLSLWSKYATPKEIDDFSKMPVTQDWVKSHKDNFLVNSKEKIKKYIEDIDSVLKTVTNFNDVFPLIFRAWSDDPERLVAYVLWLLKRGQSSKDIVDSKLFHYYFIGCIENPSNKDGLVFRLMACMREQEELKPILEKVSKISANFYFKDIAPGSASYHSSYPNRALTGEELSVEQSSQPEMLETLRPRLVLPNTHDVNSYFNLFGLAYIVELIETDNTQYFSDIKSILGNLRLEEIINFLPQINFSKLLNIKFEYLLEALGEDKILQILEKKHWFICRFMTSHLWKSYFEKLTVSDKNILIEEIKTQPDLNVYALLIALYSQDDTSELMRENIYAVILDAALKVDEDENLDKFLKRQASFHQAYVQNKAKSYCIDLNELREGFNTSGLTEDFVNLMHDAWGSQLNSYNRFKRLYPNINTSYPDTKYALNVSIIQLEISLKKENVNLSTALDLIEKNTQAHQRLLTELLLSTNDDVTQELIIKEITKKFPEIDWKFLSINDKFLEQLTAEYANATLYKKITNKKIDSDWSDRALLFAVEKNKEEIVTQFLNMSGDDAPTGKGLDKALSAAVSKNHQVMVNDIFTIIVDAIVSTTKKQKYVYDFFIDMVVRGGHDIIRSMLAVTSPNTLTQSCVDKLLCKAAGYGDKIIVQDILAMSGENKPSQDGIKAALREINNKMDYYNDFNSEYKKIVEYILNMTGNSKLTQENIVKFLSEVVKKEYKNIAPYILNMTGDNKPTQESVSNALIVAAGEWRPTIVKDIIAMSGDNKPTQESVNYALTEAATNRYVNIVKDIIAMPGDNKPTQNGVNDALTEAAKKGSLYIVKDIIAMSGDNKPTPQGVNGALQEAVENYSRAMTEDPINNNLMSNSSKATEVESYQTISKDILAMSVDNKPTQEGVSNVLYSAVNMNNQDIVVEIFGMQGDNKPTQDTIEKAKNILINFENFEKELCKLNKFQNIHPEVNRVYDIFLYVKERLRENDVTGAIAYLEKEKTKIEMSIKKLQSFSRIKTFQNIITTILSCVACIAFLGLPIVYVKSKLQENYEKRGSQFMFFSDGAKQTSKVCLYQLECLKTNILGG